MQKFGNALRHGFDGIGYTIRTQRNFRIQSLIFIVIIIFGFIFNISPCEWLAILLISSIVLSLEIVNTAIEKAVDTSTNGDYSPHAKIAKDTAAGAVVLASLFSIIIGLIIFIPKILRYLK